MHISLSSRLRNPRWMTAGVFAVAAILVFCLCIDEPLIADEHQFIASGALMRHWILPYRDYHYFHLPTMVIIYAILFKTTSYLLLAARSFSAVCAAGAVAAIFHVALNRFAHLARNRQLLLSGGIALLLLTNPLFIYTSRLAWNHSFPLLMTLLAFLAIGRGLRDGSTLFWITISGLMAGLAVTSRLTFAPAMLAFVLFIGLYPRLAYRRRILLLFCFCLGFLVASIPTIWLWMQAPGNAFFGNFLYPALNTQYHLDTIASAPRRFTVIEKLAYLLKSLITLPGNGVLVVLFVVLVVKTLRVREIRRDPKACELFVINVLVVTLAAAGFAPSPMYRQYVYAATPFMILGIALCLSRLENVVSSVAWQRILAGCLAVTIAFGIFEYDGIVRLPFFQTWVPVQVHDAGVRISRQADRDRILTLAPIYPLEGGSGIFKELVTGRFGVRAAEYLTEAERDQYLMSDADDINQLLDHRPSAVLIAGSNKALDEQLTRAVAARGYRAIEFKSPLVLWLPARR